MLAGAVTVAVAPVGISDLKIVVAKVENDDDPDWLQPGAVNDQLTVPDMLSFADICAVTVHKETVEIFCVTIFERALVPSVRIASALTLYVVP